MDETAWAQQGYYAVRALDEHVHSDLRPLLRDGAVAGHAHQDPYASYVPLVPGLGAPERGWDGVRDAHHCAGGTSGDWHRSGQADSEKRTSLDKLLRKREM